MDILPTKLNVAKRIGRGDTCYPFCNSEDESIIHVFLNFFLFPLPWILSSLSLIPQSLLVTPWIENHFCFRLSPRLLYLLTTSGFSKIKLFIV